MNGDAARLATGRRRASANDFVSYGLIIGAVVLGWQMAIQPLMQRAPVETAIRLGPGSPTVLRRAAEAELAAGRVENAAELGRDALARSPFDVRALRVVGLTEARAGREDQADEILTLAGNWSLRDDPSHAWLIERRLRRGDYASSFAHADTLVRRRADIQPQVFRLFTVAGAEDPQRALPVIASLLSARPPWRQAYLSGLRNTPEEIGVAASLAILLEGGRAPLTKEELEGLYWLLLNKGQIPALVAVRDQIDRPPTDVAVTNGEFTDMGAPQPFQWSFYQKAGIAVEVIDDDVRPDNRALRIDYDGYATGTIAEQLTALRPGTYRFTARLRTESGDPGGRLAWTLSCATAGGAGSSVTIDRSAARSNGWSDVTGRMDVPVGCPLQSLRLETRAADRRSPLVVWFDDLGLSRPVAPGN